MAARPLIEVTAQNEREAWRLRTVERLTEPEIAGRLGVSQSTVSRMLRRVEKRLAREFAEQAERVKARQAALLDHVVSEALAGWERSTDDAVTERSVSDGEKTTTTTERRGQAGAPSFLAECRAALADIRAIYGLDAPKKQDLTTGGQPIKALIGVDPEDM